MNETNVESLRDKYKKTAMFIVPYINPHIIATYERYIKGKESECYLYENYVKITLSNSELIHYPKDNLSMKDIVASLLTIALSKENIDDAIRTYKENRRVYKRNWFNSIKEEIEGNPKPRNPKLLRKYAETVKSINELNREYDSKDTVEDIMNQKYEEILEWKNNTLIPIIDFFFFSQKPVKSITNAFVTDLLYDSLNIIANDFSGRIEGYNINFPSNMDEHPIFSFRNTIMSFESAIISDQICFLNNYKIESENGLTEEQITVQYTPAGTLPVSASKQEIQRVAKEYEIENQYELDMKDREIATQLFNRITVDNLNDPIFVNLSEFTKTVLNVKVPKKKNYDDIYSRLTKIRNYDYKISVYNKETAELMELSSFGILSSLYINREEGYFTFTPSEQLVQTYVHKKYTSILAESYTKIDSPQTRGIMMILQKIRLSEYNKQSSSTILTLNFFRLRLKMIKMSNSAVKKELEKCFINLKENDIVIKDFEFINKNSAIHFEFTSLTERELMAYDFNNIDDNELSINKNIIEGSYKEIQTN